MRSNTLPNALLVATIGAALTLAGCSRFAPGDWFFDDAPIAAAPPSSSVAGASPTAAPSGPPAPYEASATCKTCHGVIYSQWQDSMHAHALRGPVMIAQTQLDMQHSLGGQSKEAQQLCVNCHGPISALATDSPTLPLPGGPAANEGISCVTCHALSGKTEPGGAGTREGFGAKVQQGRKYYGPIAQPTGNSFHASEQSDTFKDTDSLCASCHNVNLDRDKDGKITKGKDLVLQTTFDEYADYRRSGGTQSCVDCHMRVVGTQSVAELAPGSTPPRALHDHSFVGVDFPLDLPQDPQLAKRQALLASAATMNVKQESPPGSPLLVFSVSITNTTGHNLPTGFAFARQMWLEVRVTGAGNVPLFSSGVLAQSSDDLCDRLALQDAQGRFMLGCTAPDDQLVNLQLKLVDKVEADRDSSVDRRGDAILVPGEGASETVLQFVEGGPVARKRLGGESLAPLEPFETRTFQYRATLNDGGLPGTSSLDVRLLFRSLPPYFLRSMDAMKNGGKPLADYVDKLAPITITSAHVPL